MFQVTMMVAGILMFAVIVFMGLLPLMNFGRENVEFYCRSLLELLRALFVCLHFFLSPQLQQAASEEFAWCLSRRTVGPLALKPLSMSLALMKCAVNL